MISGSAYNVQAEINRQHALSQQIAQLQTDISSGVKIHVASDDPAAAAQVATIQQDQSDAGVYATNIATAKSTSGQVDSSLTSVANSLVRAKELMLQAANGTLSASDRTAIATELSGIRQDIAAQAVQTDATGQPLFAPTGTSALQIPIAKGVTVAAADSYDQVFGPITMPDGTSQSLDDMLNTAITALNANDQTGVQASLSTLDTSADHINAAQADIGIRETRLANAQDALTTRQTNLTAERSSLEDTDATAAYVTLSNKMTVLNAAQSVLVQLKQSSLFDKLS